MSTLVLQFLQSKLPEQFVGGVLSTQSTWVIGFASFVARVRAGAEVLASPRLAIVLYKKYEENNPC